MFERVQRALYSFEAAFGRKEIPVVLVRVDAQALEHNAGAHLGWLWWRCRLSAA